MGFYKSKTHSLNNAGKNAYLTHCYFCKRTIFLNKNDKHNKWRPFNLDKTAHTCKEYFHRMTANDGRRSGRNHNFRNLN